MGSQSSSQSNSSNSNGNEEMKMTPEQKQDFKGDPKVDVNYNAGG